MSTFQKTNILIPYGVSLCRWSVIACDQFTSQPEYWEACKNFVADSPSTLNVVYPEAWLSQGEERIDFINNNMKKYITDGIFKEYKNSLIYTRRHMSNGKVRTGIIGAVDLEEYDFSVGSKSKVRATEGTVTSRIPPRVKVRENAILEFPHAILLIDDPDKQIIESVTPTKKLYDFPLMLGGGRLEGFLIDDLQADCIINMLDSRLVNDNLEFAVGDGNHSLATAKQCWENLKHSLPEPMLENHPARYCLVEIENIHDDAIEFEPIHRVLFGVEPQRVIDALLRDCPNVSLSPVQGAQQVTYVTNNKTGTLYVKTNTLAVGVIEKFISKYSYKCDYIHGSDTVYSLCEQDKTLGFILPAMQKPELFKTVIADGSLPRKTFSMGNAVDKRYYMEAKVIK